MTRSTLSWGQAPRGSVEFSEEDGVWHGKLLGTRHVITYESESEKGLFEEYKGAVLEYFALVAAPYLRK